MIPIADKHQRRKILCRQPLRFQIGLSGGALQGRESQATFPVESEQPPNHPIAKPAFPIEQ
jgi:hypothetical protein